MKKIPLISIIIPVYNDHEGLSDTLASIVNQNFAPDSSEIIIVDNGSKDRSVGVANEFKEKYPDIIKVLIEDKIKSSYAARNMGINSSTGEIIVFIDADMAVEPEWLVKIKDMMTNDDVKYIGCNVEMVLKNKSIAGLYNKIMGFKVGERIKYDHYAPTCCLAIKREIIGKIGLFDHRLISGGDREFGHRVWIAGYKQFFAENIKIYHPARDSMKKLLKKHFRTGRGKFLLGYYYPDIYPSDKNVSIKHLFIKPKSFIKSMQEKKSDLNWIYLILLYFIKCFKRAASLSGYYYERNSVGKRHAK